MEFTTVEQAVALISRYFGVTFGVFVIVLSFIFAPFLYFNKRFDDIRESHKHALIIALPFCLASILWVIMQITLRITF